MAFIHIDPAHPVVWRSPSAIQIGGPEPLVTLDAVTDADERMLAAARAGIPSDGLIAVGGCSPREVVAFVDRIRPALVAERPGRIEVALRITSNARAEIVRVARTLELAATPIGRRPHVGLVVADHAVPLRAYRDWMRESVAHVAVVFGTRDVTVAPVVPGVSGCLRCEDLERTESDPAWPAVAAQLVDRRAAATQLPLARVEALCAALRLAESLGSLVDAPARAALADRGGIRIDARAGRRMQLGSIAPHPECGCRLDLQAPLALAG